jgi:hypothetical protein
MREEGRRKVSEKLEGIARVLTRPAEIGDVRLHFLCWFTLDTKEEVVRVIRAIGGKWTKAVRNGDWVYPQMVFTHESGLEVHIARDRVCRRLNPEWECEPLFSLEEEKELVSESL